MKRKLLLSGAALVTFVVLLIIFYFNHQDTSICKEQWAINNYGQKVNGKPGISGIDTNVLKAWKITKGNSNILIAVIDSGVDFSCKGLTTATKSHHDDGWDFYHNDSTVYDTYLQDYHGTYIANTIAGNGADKNVVGIAPGLSLISIKFMRGTSGNITDAIKAIEHAIKIGANVINCSWMFSEKNLELEKIIKNNPDILFVCAAGNSSDNLDKYPKYPASYEFENIISVMAIDNCGNRYSSSGWGSSVKIAAPGVDILTVFPEGDISYISGTSIATAYVSGIAGLMLSVNKNILPKDLISIVVNTATKTDTLKGLCTSEGIVNAYESVSAAMSYKSFEAVIQ